MSGGRVFGQPLKGFHTREEAETWAKSINDRWETGIFTPKDLGYGSLRFEFNVLGNPRKRGPLG